MTKILCTQYTESNNIIYIYIKHYIIHMVHKTIVFSYIGDKLTTAKLPSLKKKKKIFYKTRRITNF